MKISTVFSAYKQVLGKQIAYLMFPTTFSQPSQAKFRQVTDFELWLNSHIPAMEQELARVSRQLRNLDTAWGGYLHQKLNLKERKAFLETKRENRRHLRRIRVLEAKIEIYESKLNHASWEVADLLKVNEELHHIKKLFREIIDTLQGFVHPRSHIFPVGIEIDKGIVEYATQLEKELAAYKSFFTSPGDVWGNRDRWLKGQQKGQQK